MKIVDKHELFKNAIEREIYSLAFNLNMQVEPTPSEEAAYIEIDGFKYIPIHRMLNLNTGKQAITLRCISDLSKEDISIDIDNELEYYCRCMRRE